MAECGFLIKEVFPLMKIKKVLFASFLFWFGAPLSASVQVPPPKDQVPPHPHPVQMQLPPKEVLTVQKMQLPPAPLQKPAPIQKITINPPPVAAPDASNVPGVKTGQEVSSQDDPRVSQSNADYAVWLNDFTRRTYEHQLFQSGIIFILVLLMVCAGLFFSWLQFQHSFHLKQVIKNSVAQFGNANADPAPPPDEFSFGKDGIVVRSAYLGIIILVISMAFFFLYLKYVYLIT